jgi:aspartate/tyrosine/aromatic aminotransferase
VYMPDSGRIAIKALSEERIEHVARAVDSTVRRI